MICLILQCRHYVSFNTSKCRLQVWFTHDDAWPEHPTLKRLYYVRKADNANPTMLLETRERDLAWFREEVGQGD